MHQGRLTLPLFLSYYSLALKGSSAFTSPHLVDFRRTPTLLHATAINAPLSLESISVTLPVDWKSAESSGDDDGSWSNEAAAILRKHGAVALVSNDDEGGGGLMNSKVCDGANNAAFSRVEDMHSRIERRGMDPTGAEEPYRFAEIVCRDDGGRRFDVPVPWLGEKDVHDNSAMGQVGSGRIGAPLSAMEEDAIAGLHNSIGDIVPTIMDALWSNNHNVNDDGDVNDGPNTQQQSYVAAAGFLMNKPGSQSQKWHRDGPDEGFIDCFVPLIDLNESVGPTAIQPGTHRTTNNSSSGENHDDNDREVLIPILKKGDILLFDYRTIHRGLGNVSESTTRTLAYAVYKRKDHASCNQSGDVHNFPAALTLEYD